MITINKMTDLSRLLSVPEVRKMLNEMASIEAAVFANYLESENVYHPTWEENFEKKKTEVYNSYLKQLGYQPGDLLEKTRENKTKEFFD